MSKVNAARRAIGRMLNVPNEKLKGIKQVRDKAKAKQSTPVSAQKKKAVEKTMYPHGKKYNGPDPDGGKADMHDILTTRKRVSRGVGAKPHAPGHMDIWTRAVTHPTKTRGSTKRKK